MPVLIVLENLAQKHDLSTLTPTETANLAYRISRYAAPDAGQLAQLEKIFAPVQSQYMQEPLEESLRHLAEIMHDDHGALSSAVAMTGRLALSPFLEGQTDVIRTKFPSGRHPLLEGRFWDTVRAQLAARPDSKIMSLDKTALDLQLLGRFDKNPGAPIDPAQYETSEYQTYLHEARETHMTAQIKKRKSPVTRIM